MAGATATPTASVDAGDAGAALAAQGDAATGAAGACGEPPAGMLLVEGGTFKMGSDDLGELDERPAHDVTVASYFLDRTEVTQTAYAQCVAAGACKSPDGGLMSGAFVGPNKPVVAISWFAAREYCVWRGGRLPREAEFERAVRGADGRRYPWGNDAPTRERAVFSAGAPEEVATHPSGRGPYGHDDLAGNVWEWIDDDYDPLAYTRATAAEGKPAGCDEIVRAQNKLRTDGREGFTGSNPIPTECEKAIRGGAYNYPGPGLRSTNRVHHPASYKLKMTGVRCAKSCAPPK